MKKFLILLILLTGCSSKESTYTREQINQCAEISSVIADSSYEMGSVSCIIKIKHKGWGEASYFIPVDQLTGALHLQLAYMDIQKAPERKICLDKCLKRAKKPVCPGDKEYSTQQCYQECR